MPSSGCLRPRRFNRVEAGPADRETVVLLHAVGLDLTYWDRQIEALADRYRVVAVDLPGHGMSDPPPRNAGIGHLAQDVADIVEADAGGSAHIVGHSFGGMIAQQLALSRPGLVKSLTLIATAATFTDETRAFMRSHAASVRQDGMGAVVPLVTNWLAPATVERRPDILDRLEKSIRAMDAAVYAPAWDRIAHFDAADQLAALTCPTLVVAGGRDTNTPVADVTLLAKAIPHAELSVIADAAHMIPLDTPDRLNKELLGFLATVGPCPRTR